MNQTEIDVVIPCATKDLKKLQSCVDGIIAHTRTPVRNIYIVSNDPHVSKHISVARRICHVDDREYPFSRDEVIDLLLSKDPEYTNGSYYFQQLLKLYIFRAIPELLDRVLFVDSDFILSSDINFLDESGRALLSFGYPFDWLTNTRNYPASTNHIHTKHARSLVPGWKTCHPYSGMHHHMVFHRNILTDLLSSVEESHAMEFWRAFIDAIDTESKKWNAASEYVIYHHFALSRYPAQVRGRHLKTCDIIHEAENDAEFLVDLDLLRRKHGFQAVGCHAFIALRDRIATMDYIPDAKKSEMLSRDVSAFKLTLDDGVLTISEFAPASSMYTAPARPEGVMRESQSCGR